MAATLSFHRLRSILVSTLTYLPDYQTRPATVCELADDSVGSLCRISHAVAFVSGPSARYVCHQDQKNARNLSASIRYPAICGSAISGPDRNLALGASFPASVQTFTGQ
jgi:hypothetical protein